MVAATADMAVATAAADMVAATADMAVATAADMVAATADMAVATAMGINITRRTNTARLK